MLKKIAMFGAVLLMMVVSLGCQSNGSNGKYDKVFAEDGRIIKRDFERIVHLDQPSNLKPR